MNVLMYQHKFTAKHLDVLKNEGFTPHFAVGCRQGLEQRAALSPDVVLRDIRMPAVGGLEVLTDRSHDGDVVPLSSEKQFLQREIKDDVPGWLNALAYSLVIGSWLALVLFFGWCYASASKPGTTADRPISEPVSA